VASPPNLLLYEGRVGQNLLLDEGRVGQNLLSYEGHGQNILIPDRGPGRPINLTTTTLMSSANPSVVGQIVTFTATVGAGGGSPTGTVTFVDVTAGTTLGVAPLLLVGGLYQASTTATFAVAAMHTILATYSGDALFSGSSGQLVQSTTTFGAVSSAGVFNSQNQLVRTIWSTQVNDPRAATPTAAAASWDGVLDDGTIAPTGTYSIGIVGNNCTYTWDGVAGNTCPDHYKPANYLGAFTYIGGTTPIWGMAITNAGDVYFNNNYHEKRFPCFFTTTADMQHAFIPELWPNYPFTFEQPGVVDWAGNFSGSICTDGTNVFMSFQSDATMPNRAVVGSTHQGLNSGASFGAYTAGDGNGFTTGIAAQYAATGYVYVFHPASTAQTITVCDKVSGATITTLTSPVNAFCGCCNPVNANELWINYGGATGSTNHNITEKFTIAPLTGLITTTGVQITGPITNQGLAISPDGATLLLADVNTNQVRAYNTSDGSVKTAFGTSGVFGQSGGYSNGPAVTNDKFMFVSPATGLGTNLGAYICFAPDGSWWLGDSGNWRNLHFSSGNSPTVIETVAYMPTCYSQQVCHGDPTRILAYHLEWKIDYSKPFTPSGGGWTLTNNWGNYLLAHPEFNTNSVFTLLLYFGVYSNGKTYGVIRISTGSEAEYFFELQPGIGLRNTNSSFSFRNVIDPSTMNMYSMMGSGQTPSFGAPGGGTQYLNPFTGFDGSSNPTWAGDPTTDAFTFAPGPTPTGWVSFITSQLTPSQYPALEVFASPTSQLQNGIYPTFISRPSPATGSGTWTNTNRIVGVDATGRWRFGIHPEQGPLSGNLGKAMYFPDTPYTITGGNQAPTNNFQGSFLAQSGKSDFFSSVRGEVWNGGQTNRWIHWHQSGLAIGHFGQACGGGTCVGVIGAPEFSNLQTIYGPHAAPDFWWGVPGHAGNVASGGIAYADSNNTYVYHSEEWVHSGIHRWHVANASSISFFNNYATVNWNSANYVPPSTTGSDMLAGLPYYNHNLPNNSAGWVRNPTSNVGTWPGSDPLNGNGSAGWIVCTNMVIADSHVSPDLYLGTFQTAPASSWSISKAAPRVGTGNWTLTVVGNLGSSGFWDASSATHQFSAIFMELVDGSSKRIFSIFLGQYRNDDRGMPFANSLWVNENPVIPVGIFAPIGTAANNSIGAYAAGGYDNSGNPIFDGSQFHNIPPIIVSANVLAGNFTVSYGIHGPATTFTVYDAGADIVHPSQLQFNFRADPMNPASIVHDIFSLTFTNG
jgi:hypothetical protein